MEKQRSPSTSTKHHVPPLDPGRNTEAPVTHQCIDETGEAGTLLLPYSTLSVLTLLFLSCTTAYFAFTLFQSNPAAIWEPVKRGLFLLTPQQFFSQSKASVNALLEDSGFAPWQKRCLSRTGGQAGGGARTHSRPSPSSYDKQMLQPIMAAKAGQEIWFHRVLRK